MLLTVTKQRWKMQICQVIRRIGRLGTCASFQIGICDTILFGTFLKYKIPISIIMAQFIGYMVSIECAKGRGTYQGEIVAATNSTITLTKAFCDGIPCEQSEVKVRADDIVDLKLIEKQCSPPGRSTITIAKPIAKRAGRTQSMSESTSTLKISQNTSKSRPIDIEQKQHTNSEHKSLTPNKKEKNRNKWNKSWKDEACFGSPLDHSINKDFDFEKNLALFDKRAIWDEINNSQKPDVVKHADHVRKQTRYRHDENVLTSQPTALRQIVVPKLDFCEYVTDNGLVIPSISHGLRNKLWGLADEYGLSFERRSELMGRAATELSLQLVGGGHRLTPHNNHQWPTIAVLCGSHKQGAVGINTARQLSSHGLNTVVYVNSMENPHTRQELSLYRLTRNKIVTLVSSLPQNVDLIIVALSEESGHHNIDADVITWVNSSRAPVLALDPPTSGTPGITAKYSLIPVLPLPHSPENGRLYLCNLSFPLEIFREVGIKYYSPFGQKFVIALHPNTDP